MAFYQIIVLAVIQGITEFLPVSSQAHLIIFPKVMHWPDQGHIMDVAVHAGTLGAVVAYFWRDSKSMLTGSFNLLRGSVDRGGRLFLLLSVATLPIIVVGTYASAQCDDIPRSIAIIGWASLLYGLLLFVVDSHASTQRTLKDMTYLRSFFVGVAQVLAIIPGTSRAGSCITALRFMGFSRSESAHYSCLMSIPTILAAATLTGYKVCTGGDGAVLNGTLLAAGLSFVASLGSITFMMRWVQKSNFFIFVLYRVILGIGLLAWVYI